MGGFRRPGRGGGVATPWWLSTGISPPLLKLLRNGSPDRSPCTRTGQ